jgi:hypothetical protein
MAPSAESRELAESVRRGAVGPSAPRAPLPPALLTGEREPVGREDALRRLAAGWARVRAGGLMVARGAPA